MIVLAVIVLPIVVIMIGVVLAIPMAFVHMPAILVAS